MEIQAQYSRWTIIDSMAGGYVYPYEVSILDAIEDCGGNDAIYSVEVEFGWCARYSLDGYLDCTEWVGPYSWKHQSVQACKETYGEQDAVA